MDSEGEPFRFCGEVDKDTHGSIGFTSQGVGFSEFFRHPLRSQRSPDSHLSHPADNPELSIFNKWNRTSGLLSSSSSTTSLSSDSQGKWQLKHTELDKSSDSNAQKIGRSSTWSSSLMISGTQFDEHPDTRHKLSIVPEISTEPVETLPTIASLPVFAASKSFPITHDTSIVSKAPADIDIIPHIEPNKSREICHETIGAIVFSARPTRLNCDLSSISKGTDSHSIFGLPSRIQVTKRELNMMTPSSF